ncbi:uncharacterized protein C9orf152-like [Myxocyprinus asiaticus]|uniref:uncharacterized protein C9orf152-like n=1 Tax=Myxocyprinus asiaticus TaxID=70543 RepID=UPI002223222F|nr:uncharacterized protein C9orf152-like [Myxocyprinus asiaticus]
MCSSCSSVTCADVWAQMRKSHSQEEDQNTTSVRMDIALLKEQYNTIKDKQRRETRVVCFTKEVNHEEISGKNLVDIVPVCQAKHSPLTEASVLETQFGFVEDPESGPWHTHLDVYRMTHATNGIEHSNHTSNRSRDLTAETASTEDSDGNHHLKNSTLNNCITLNSRKLSAPAVLSRQLSFGSYRSCPTPATSRYYPFPQMKCPKKSETARRLGLYSSI